MSINLKNYTPEQQAEINQLLEAERKAGREEGLKKKQGLIWQKGEQAGYRRALEEAAKVIADCPFDRGQEHHDYNNESYCPECHMCIDCGKRELADRIRQLGGE